MADWTGPDLEGLVLHSGRLTLRPWQASDADAVRKIMADDRMGRYLPLPHPYTAQAASDFVTGAGITGRAEGSRLDCAVAENTSGRLVGSASLRLPVQRRSGEIGYWLATADWGHGYATEAVQTLARFGFSNGVDRIEIVCEVANAASARVALRAGFAFEAINRSRLPHDQDRMDSALFARLPGDPGTAIEPMWAPMSELADGVITVRPTVAEDWPVLLAEANNDVSRLWSLSPDPLTEAAAVGIAEGAGLNWLVARQANLTICDAASGAGAGMMMLRQVGPPNVVGVGYGVLPEFRGRRFTTRALRLVADWAFEQTPIVRLELGCKVDNVASARSAEAAGFVADARYTGRLRNPNGSYSDEIGYSRVRG